MLLPLLLQDSKVVALLSAFSWRTRHRQFDALAVFNFNFEPRHFYLQVLIDDHDRVGGIIVFVIIIIIVMCSSFSAAVVVAVAVVSAAAARFLLA